jgi:FADH2 O2-dependent halogenase
MSRIHFEIAVVGSGFAGSLMALMAHRLGLSTVLIERGRHPRFVIGESSTPLANLLLEEISEEYDLPSVRPLCKWGSWQKQFPQVAAGIKRGFTFYHHEFGKPFSTNARANQLLVGASPNEEIADTHWYRPDFDHYLVAQAQKLGVTYLDETELTSAREEANGLILTGARHGERLEIAAEFVIDATGPRGFLCQALGLPEKIPAHLPPTQGLFSHFENVGALPEYFFTPGQIPPPYPPEQAAVHHIFPGGWIWVLKFNNGITSAGVAATDQLANDLNFKAGEPAWRRLLERLPSMADIFQPARKTMPFIHSRRLSFQSSVVTGARWALLPSAVGFVDPLLSTGFPLTLLGVQRFGDILKLGWKDSSFDERLNDYTALTTLELETASCLIGALYANMDRFEVFKELSLLYFAAASYSETARRLGKPELADGFLLCRQRVFAKQFVRICETAKGKLSAGDAKRLSRNIREAIEPLDVAGLTDSSRHPWYPALTSDLLRNVSKVNVSETEMRRMLAHCGLVD